MLAEIRKLNRSEIYSKAWTWIKLVALTGGAQVVVQIMGFVSGILILRLLPTHEYAFYILANTMLGTMTVLADSGISNGAMAEGGKVWQDKKKLGVVLNTGLALRKKYGFWSLLVSLPVLVYLLIEHGAGWITITMIVAGIIPAFFAALSDSFLEMAPKLHQDIKPLQKNQTGVSLGRLVLCGLFLFVFPFSFIALFANGIPRIYGNIQLRRLSTRYASFEEQPDLQVRQNINKSVKRTLPIVIYYCLSGQISLWLISFLGTTTSISELGALGRLAVVFTVFSYIFTTLAVPRFSRLEAVKGMVLKHFLLTVLCGVVVSFGLFIWVVLFSDQILWVLGKNYYNLKYELVLIAIGSSIGLAGGICSQLVVSRGWFIKPAVFIGMNILATVAGIYLFDFSTLQGILQFGILISILSFLLMFTYGLLNIRKMKHSPEAILEAN